MSIGHLQKPIELLRSEPPTGVIVAQEHILIHALQPVISLSSIPACILTREDVPQDAYDDNISDEVTHNLTYKRSVCSSNKGDRSRIAVPRHGR